GFSSMSGYADLTRALLREVRRLNPKAYLMWGGIHPIMAPEDAIKDADGICVGEGEFAFERFFAAFKDGKDFTGTENFWFRRKGEVVRNGLLPLMTGEQMSALPLPNYGTGEKIFRPDRGYEPLTRGDYLEFNGLGYN